jgi:hypothetical protein
LLPKLHDVRAWLARRNGTESRIEFKPGLPAKLFEVINHFAGATEALDTVRELSGEVTRYLNIPEPEALPENPSPRYRIDCKVEEIEIPAEWAALSRADGPIARNWPVCRRISNVAAPTRKTIEAMFHQGEGAPPRALLFGYGSASLPEVPEELRTIKTLIEKKYQQNEWPTELVRLVGREEARGEYLKTLLEDSDFEILHLAGHAAWNNGNPVLAVAPEEGSPFIRGEELGSCLQKSMVRFVYLSCCGGAAGPGQLLSSWRKTLCHEVLKAGVPEVAAYVWPVNDGRSVPFTKDFYESFMSDFDAPAAMFEARRACEENNPLWAASVLITQVERKR